MSEAPRVALVHDWLTARGGAEKTLATFAPGTPQSRVFPCRA